MSALFHLITPEAWAAAESAGTYHPASLDDEGFVHFSYPDQIAGTAARHYAGLDVLVLEIDPDRLPAPVVVEEAPGTGMSFPHVYAEIPVDVVVAVHDLSSFTSPDV